MDLFDSDKVNFDLLKSMAFNLRWAELPDDVIPLTAADPDFQSAPEISEAIIDYCKGQYFSYTSWLDLFVLSILINAT